MYFIDFRNKSGFPLLAFVTILLFAVSITFGATVSSAASLHKNDDGQTILSLPSNQSEKTEIIDSPIFDRFNAWVKSYVSNGYRADDEQMIYGEELAIKREKLLERLIRLDPQAALEKAVSAEISNQLPAAIAEHSEKRVSADGDFLVFTHCGREHSGAETEDSSIGHTVVINDSKYDAFVYGRRASMTTKMNIPLQGIVIGDAMAVDESPKRILNSAKQAVNNSRFSEESISAEVGGKIINFSSQAELDNFTDEQIAWESKIGPVRPEKNAANGNLAPEQTASALTLGPKKILFIRVDFSDAVGDPIFYGTSGQRLTPALAQSIYDTQINPFYVKNSYGKTSLQVTVTPTKPVRMPQTLAYYVQTKNDIAMEEDARFAALQQTGLDSNNFDFDVVGFSYTPGFDWSGQSLIGTKGSLINGDFTLRVLAHELGHNYGLLHANLWKTTDGTAIGQGSPIDYGDDFDVMGNGFSQNPNLHFNVQYKHRLEWLPDANVKMVTTSDTYTVYAQDSGQDSATLGTGYRALKIRKDTTKNYWIEFKPLSGGNAANGALIHWDYQSNNFSQTELLDMHPATPGISDAPLAIGESFTDEESGNDYAIKITVLGKGNTTPESLSIKVELYKNTNCTYSLSPTSETFSAAGGATGTINVAAGTGCSWTATTSDTSWITITRGSGIANGSVAYSVAPNSGIKRSGTITVAGQTFPIQTSARMAAGREYSVDNEHRHLHIHSLCAGL